MRNPVQHNRAHRNLALTMADVLDGMAELANAAALAHHGGFEILAVEPPEPDPAHAATVLEFPRRAGAA